jgi:trans-2,3-dihydro-3-hydroxyanthranilate isomerase
MKNLSYEVVRVFTNRAGRRGNGLAVFTDARGLKKNVMQAVAKKLGFSETSFVFPPSVKKADYRVRFFTPGTEIPFAGHPSLGTLFILRRLGLLKKKSRYGQQTSRRLIEMSLLEDGRIRMDQGKPLFGKELPRSLCASLLGIGRENIGGAGAVVSTGNPHLIVPLRDMKTLKAASVNMRVYRKTAAAYGAACVMPFTIRGGSITCRMFAPGLGVPEDPATGSGCGPLAAYLVREKLVSSTEEKNIREIEIKQGAQSGGRSLLYAWVEKAGGRINRVWVGGHCVAAARRRIDLSSLI